MSSAGQWFKETGPAPSPIDRTDLLIMGFLAAVMVPLYFLTPFARDLWLLDEPRYAEIAKEMAQTGRWVVPYLHGALYTEKPPLFFWMLAASGKLLGWTPFAMTLPAGLSAVGCVLVVYRLARILFSRGEAFLSALVLMTTVLFMGLGQYVRMDMFLLLCLSFSFLCFYRLFTKTAAHSWPYVFGFFVATGLGTLTKGPIGLGLPGLILVIFLVRTFFARGRDLRTFAVVSLGELVWGGLVYLAVALAWFIPAVMEHGWAYAYLITIKQNLGRVHNSWSHARPWYFYLYSVAWITLPWFPFLVSAPLARRLLPPRNPKERDALRFLWIWWGTTFVFFSLISGKLEIYLLPLFAPTAILVGRLWGRSLALQEPSAALLRPLVYPAYFLGGLLMAVAAGLALTPATRPYAGGAALLFGLGGLILYVGRKHALAALFGVISGFSPVLLLYTAFTLTPLLNQTLTLRPVAQDLRQLNASPGAFALCEAYYPVQYYFPSPVPILETPEAQRAFFASKTPVYCLARKNSLAGIQREIPVPVHVVGTYRIQKKRYVLISQSAPAPRPALKEGLGGAAGPGGLRETRPAR